MRSMADLQPWLLGVESITAWDVPPKELPVLILPHLLLGDAEPSQLKSKRLTHVLEATGEARSDARRSAEAEGIFYLHVPCHDGPGHAMLNGLDAALDFVATARSARGQCLLYCDDKGSDCGGMIAAAALMLQERVPVLEAVRQCKLARGVFLESKHLQVQLLQLAQQHDLLGEAPEGGRVVLPHATAGDWQRRGKWEAFYAGVFAPHMPNAADRPIESLPWRSKAATPQLLEYLSRSPLPADARCIELGCGTGENLVHLAGVAAFACGIDVAAAAVHASNEALVAAARTNAQAVALDVLALPSAADSIQLADGQGWQFDFALDVQTFHCVRKVDALRAALAYDSLLRPGGALLMLTGNADEPEERGPERLTRQEVLRAFDGTALICTHLESFRFEWTETYRRQPFDQPPLGWISIWTKQG